MRSIIPDPTSPGALDRVNRQFRAERLNQRWVSDFTCVSTWQGWVCVAFVVDVFSPRVVGGRQSSSMHTELVLDALEQALHDRKPDGGGSLTHRSDRDPHGLTIRYSERQAEAGMEPSVDSKGKVDRCDHALAETISFEALAAPSVGNATPSWARGGSCRHP